MTKKLRQYHFKTSSQWQSCFFAQADGAALRSDLGFKPLAPYAAESQRFESPGGKVPVVLRGGEILWCDDNGALHQAFAGGAVSEVFPAPSFMARARRAVSSDGRLWFHRAGTGTIDCYEQETFTRRITVDLPDARILDVAADGRTLRVLVQSDDDFHCRRVSDAGRELEAIQFERIESVKAFVYLRRSQRFVILAGDRHQSLYWFAAEGGQPLFSEPLGGLEPCFRTDLLASDGNERIVLAGNNAASSVSDYGVLILDGDGNRIAQVQLDAPATGITASQQNLIVTDARGLLSYETAKDVPNTSAEMSCTVVTPLLESVTSENIPPWLRIEAVADLPEGTTLEISYAATDDKDVLNRLRKITTDPQLSSSHRARALLNEHELHWSQVSFQSSGQESRAPAAPRSAPLFDLRARHLWASLTLTAARGARLPVVHEFSVLYPGHSLVENLPTPYRRAAAEPGNFLRALLGVLEATTQNLDGRIAALGSHIHPETAEGNWLNYIARWLGLPWDDAMSETQKREILLHAAELARARGTRAGLELLLECLLPGSPHRFRVTDTTADFGYAVVGGAQCIGSALPAMLGGFTRWHSELDATTVLGYTRLPCPNRLDDSAQWLSSKILVEVAAMATEPQGYAPWLPALVQAMVPLTARVQLRLVSAQALRTNQLDGSLELRSAPDAYLGTDAVTDRSHLPEGSGRAHLSASGPSIGIPLR